MPCLQQLPLNAMPKQGCRLRLLLCIITPNLSMTVGARSQASAEPDLQKPYRGLIVNFDGCLCICGCCVCRAMRHTPECNGASSCSAPSGTTGFEVSLARSPPERPGDFMDTRGFELCRKMRAYVDLPQVFTPLLNELTRAAGCGFCCQHQVSGLGEQLRLGEFCCSPGDL